MAASRYSAYIGIAAGVSLVLQVLILLKNECRKCLLLLLLLFYWIYNRIFCVSRVQKRS